MESQSYYDASHDHIDESIEAEDLREALSTLRNDFNSIAGDIRIVLQENARLSNELRRLKARPRKNRKRNDVQRIKRECIDGLVHLQDLASRFRTPQKPAPQRGIFLRQRPHDDGGAATMKKMMMAMLLSELV